MNGNQLASSRESLCVTSDNPSPQVWWFTGISREGYHISVRDYGMALGDY